MPKMIFVNLPVAKLTRSKAFYEALGARVEPRFTDETAACMVFSEAIHVMLLSHDKFREFATRPIAEARQVTETLLCLSAESRGEVDATAARALGAGGTEPRAAQDYGFMYGRSVEDPDGHVWELMWMDPAQEGVGAAPETAGA